MAINNIQSGTTQTLSNELASNDVQPVTTQVALAQPASEQPAMVQAPGGEAFQLAQLRERDVSSRERINRTPMRPSAQTDPDYAAITRSDFFRTASPEVKRTLQELFAHRADDAVFRGVLKDLIVGQNFFRSPDTGLFQVTRPADQLAIFRDLHRFTETKSYREAGRVSDTAPSVNHEDSQKFILNNIAHALRSRQLQPQNAPLRNTLEHVISGNITVRGYGKLPHVGGEDVPAPKGRLYNNAGGYSDPQTGEIYINRKKEDRGNFIVSLAHEINHMLNDRALGLVRGASPEEFLYEYRAYLAGFEAGGFTQSRLSGVVKQAINELGRNESQIYTGLQRLYKSNSQFSRVVDEVYAAAESGQVMSAEQVRQRLLEEGFGRRSTVLRTPGNDDNR